MLFGREREQNAIPPRLPVPAKFIRNSLAKLLLHRKSIESLRGKYRSIRIIRIIFAPDRERTHCLPAFCSHSSKWQNSYIQSKTMSGTVMYGRWLRAKWEIGTPGHRPVLRVMPSSNTHSREFHFEFRTLSPLAFVYNKYIPYTL